ncbi:hypothetical protein NFI96_026690 [Prochilodus magdalenae]|nr:hypothetical protein NFI96_026690 [Prochilodus magdalenae]
MPNPVPVVTGAGPGTGESFDVIGYSGGSIIIHSDLLWSSGGVKYFDKDGKFTVWISELHSGDGAQYCFGVKDQRSKEEIELKVQTDCCGGRKVMNTHLGETVTITCRYPDMFKENHKLFFKLENRSTVPEIITTGTETRRDRFSISEDSSSKVLSVRISDVREDDGGVYYCGVWKEEGSAGYHSLHTEIHLQLTGTGDSFDVIGYSGGTVLIHSDLPWSSGGVKYLGKTDLQNGACLDIIKDESGKTSIHHTRFSLYNKDGKFTVWIRELDSGLAARYCFGVKDQRKEIDLKVQTDCCGGRKVMNTHLEETVTITCTYPDTFKENHKLFFKPENRSTIPGIIATGTETQRDRFSVSEDRSSKVLTVRISDVREDDLGVYYCGVWKEEGSAGYHSLHTEIHLQLTASGSSVITTVIICIFVVLLLIGGSALIFYRLRCQKDSSSVTQRTQTENTANRGHENDPSVNRNTSMRPLYHSQNPNTNQSDSVYQSLDLNTNQSDSVYQSLDPNTNQSDSVYQSINPQTNPSDSIYQSLNPNTNQSDSVYQTLNPQTNQSDSIYQSLNPNTNQSDLVDQSKPQHQPIRFNLPEQPPVGRVLQAASCGQSPIGSLLWAASHLQCPVGSVLWGSILWGTAGSRIIHQKKLSSRRRPVGSAPWVVSCGQRPVGSIPWAATSRAASCGQCPTGSLLWAASRLQCPVGNVLWGSILWGTAGSRIIHQTKLSSRRGGSPVGRAPWEVSCGQHPVGSMQWGSILWAESYRQHPVGNILWAGYYGQHGVTTDEGLEWTVSGQSGQFSLHEDKDGKFTVWIRELDSRDAARYCFGVKDQRSEEIDLKVQTDCCGGRKVMDTHLGETVTIKCTYPDTFKENHKLFFKPENRSTIPEIIPTGTETWRNRFSISEDSSSKVLTVKISDVREDDLGVYYCGVWKEEGSAGYHSLHAEIQLQLTGSFFTIIIITVGVCVALLLIGGLAVIIYCVKRKKRQVTSAASRPASRAAAVSLLVLVSVLIQHRLSEPLLILLRRLPVLIQSQAFIAGCAPVPAVHLVDVQSSLVPFLIVWMKLNDNKQANFKMKILQFRMMILWISTLYLISVMFVLLECESTEDSVSFSQCEVFLFWSTGPACCFDVVGYSGGSVILFPDLKWGVNNTRYVCKVEKSVCTYIMKDQTNSKMVNAGRFKMLTNTHDEFLLLIRELNPQDSAMYRCGVGNESHKYVELTVQTDSCCGRIEKINAYLGETATFTCTYPDEFKTNNKYLIHIYNQTTVKALINTRKDSQVEQKDRSSIFDDRRSKVFSVNISGVSEDDGGVYLCGVWKKDKSVGYYSYFKEIQLQVTVMFVLLECESTEDSVSFSQCEVFLFWSAGPAYSSDVVGYSGGSVLMFPGLQWDVNHARYVCKVEGSGCTYIMKDQTNRKEVNAGRFTMYSNVVGNFTMLIRELNPQDSAVYRFGVGTERHKDVELTVQTDSCCGRIEKMNGYLGETATFTCNYPDELKTNNKYLISLNDQTTVKVIINTGKDSQVEQKDRYSIFDDRRSKVFSVNISGVREDDGGVYLCGVWKKDKSVGYYSYFKEIQLQVTGSSLITSVCVCGALLLIGGAALIIYKLRNHMRQDAVETSQRTAKHNTDDDDDDADYENVPHGNQCNLNMAPIHNGPDGNPNRSHFAYENSNPDYENMSLCATVMFVLLECESTEDSVSFSQCEVFLFWSTGPACCFDVVGYSGGSVLIFSDLQWGLNNIRYVCKVERSGCTYIMKDQTNSNMVNAGRFKMYANANDEFLLLIRELNPQDSGVYRFGVGTESHKDVELTVQTDSCCGRIEKMDVYLGETATFTCNYPDEFKTNNKYLTHLYGENKLRRIIQTGKDSQMEQKDKSSIFDDRRSKVFSVNIGGVREDDGGVYLCGVWKYQSVGHFSYFKEIQLQVPGELHQLLNHFFLLMYLILHITTEPRQIGAALLISVVTCELKRNTRKMEKLMNTLIYGMTGMKLAPGSSIIITVCVCVTLLLMGGAALIIYYAKCRRRQGSPSNSECKDNKQVPLMAPASSGTDASEKDIHSPEQPAKDHQPTYISLPPVVCEYEEIKYNRDALTSCTDASEKDIHSTHQTPKHREPTYTTVRFQKNPASLPDATVTFSKEEPDTLGNKVIFSKMDLPPGEQPLTLSTTDVCHTLRRAVVPTIFKTATIVPVPKRSTASTLNDFRPVALTPIISKCFERLVSSHVKSCLPTALDLQQFAYRRNRSTEDAISAALHIVLSHLDCQSSYVRMLFINFSSAFNTVIPSKLIYKLSQLGISTSLCNWILDFLTDRPQSVKLDKLFSSTITLNTGVPQGCVVSPLLYSLFSYDCVPAYGSNSIIKFADDTTVIGLIRADDETAYRDEVQHLAAWCNDNNLVLNTQKTKEVIVDFRKSRNQAHTPIHISGAEVECVSNFKFLGAQQRLYSLRSLKKAHLCPRILVDFYRCTIESILTNCISVWYDSCSASDRKALQRVAKTAQRITGTQLPTIEMLILWISTLYLISVMFVLLECESTEDSVSFSQCEVFLFWSAGPACCSDVVGYSGGSVLVFSDLQWGVNYTRYVCKVEQSGCTYIMKDQTNRKVINVGRFMMYSYVHGNNATMLIRELNPQDSALYRFGVGNESHKDVELTVQTDSCCGRIEKMNVSLGETATFTCNYPDEFRTNNKYLYNLKNQTSLRRIITTGKDSQVEQKYRYSIFDDRRSKVFSVNISGVREDDGGVYLCGVWKKDKSVGYYSFFQETHLQVTGSSITISVCVCGALLLIGGAALIIYKLRNHMRQDSVETSQKTAKYNTDDDDAADYENVPHGNQCNLNMAPIHNGPDGNPNRSHFAYENSNPDYENMVEHTNQSDFLYENLNLSKR